MEPIFFGNNERQLFGWLHLPAQGAPRRTAVVLCHPFGQEFVLAHRAFHGLARQLAAAGFAVLRFDYFGTGDSGGDFEQSDLAGWQQDIATAVRTVRGRVRCDDVALVGMRLGATLAAASSGEHELAALVLWDPVVDGGAYLRELQLAHWRELHPAAPIPAQLPEPLVEASGFPVSERLRDELRGIDLRATAIDPGLPVLMVETGGTEVAAELLRSWQGRGRRAELDEFARAVPAPAAWVEDEGRVLVPQAAVQQIVAWMQATA